MINNEKCHPNDNCFWNVVLILNSLFSRPDFFFYISSDGDVDREILNAKLLNIFLPFDSTTLNVCHNTRPAGLIQENTMEQKNYRITCCKEMRNRNTDCMNTKRNFM